MYHIHAAEGYEASELSRIAIESESFWGYDSDFMEKFKNSYQVTEEFIKKNPTFILHENGRIIGFYALLIYHKGSTLEFFYIKPQYIGKGYGKKMWNHLTNYCKENSINDFTLVTSPQAKEFYEKMGAIPIGEVESLLKKGRKIPILKYNFTDV